MQKWGGKNSHSCRFIYQQRADGLGHFFDFSWHWFFPSYPARESFHTSLFFALKNPVTRTVFLAWKTIPLFVQKGQRLLQPVQRLEQKYTRIIHHPDFSISSLFYYIFCYVAFCVRRLANFQDSAARHLWHFGIFMHSWNMYHYPHRCSWNSSVIFWVLWRLWRRRHEAALNE